MRKRLLVSVAFGAVGLASGLPVGDYLGLSAPLALVGCTAAGLFIGYVLSIFLDIFMTTGVETSSEN